MLSIDQPIYFLCLVYCGVAGFAVWTVLSFYLVCWQFSHSSVMFILRTESMHYYVLLLISICIKINHIHGFPFKTKRHWSLLLRRNDTDHLSAVHMYDCLRMYIQSCLYRFK